MDPGSRDANSLPSPGTVALFLQLFQMWKTINIFHQITSCLLEIDSAS